MIAHSSPATLATCGGDQIAINERRSRAITISAPRDDSGNLDESATYGNAGGAARSARVFISPNQTLAHILSDFPPSSRIYQSKREKTRAHKTIIDDATCRVNITLPAEGGWLLSGLHSDACFSHSDAAPRRRPIRFHPRVSSPWHYLPHQTLGGAPKEIDTTWFEVADDILRWESIVAVRGLRSPWR